MLLTTYSLLALATLFVASDAKVTDVSLVGGPCTKFIIDIPPRPIPYNISLTHPKLSMMSYDNNNPLKIIPNYCAEFHEEISRQSVEVCNDYPHKTEVLLRSPDARALGDIVTSPIYATCYKDPECGPLYIKIEQNCRRPAF
ncbi:uncharacterized protein LOC125227622 [Leguminivora glycinivorella]|uniref:uncharacterized protein LOC125227622 n=1 Tax=Leguminivora glycinivorella TaxID=1035111 RepID=UPI00200D5CC7|nr:uncharacterized protein LOC125227622 [Leguminivora glycinivorella]